MRNFLRNFIKPKSTLQTTPLKRRNRVIKHFERTVEKIPLIMTPNFHLAIIEGDPSLILFNEESELGLNDGEFEWIVPKSLLGIKNYIDVWQSIHEIVDIYKNGGEIKPVKVLRSFPNNIMVELGWFCITDYFDLPKYEAKVFSFKPTSNPNEPSWESDYCLSSQSLTYIEMLNVLNNESLECKRCKRSTDLCIVKNPYSQLAEIICDDISCPTD